MGKKIMLVDDDGDIRASMRLVLEDKGHQVCEADSAESCLRQVKSFAPEIMFLDLMMEELDSGLRVCRTIRQHGHQMKIYLLSAVGEQAAGTIDTQAAGFNGALTKPIRPNELLALVQ